MSTGVFNGEIGVYWQQMRAKKEERYRQKELERSRRRNKQPRNKLKKKLWKYKISPEKFFQMYANQEGRCAIESCRKPISIWGGGWVDALHIDHDPKTGKNGIPIKVRGLLCGHCNTRMAVIDNDEFLKSALIYKAKTT